MKHLPLSFLIATLLATACGEPASYDGAASEKAAPLMAQRDPGDMSGLSQSHCSEWKHDEMDGRCYQRLTSAPLACQILFDRIDRAWADWIKSAELTALQHSPGARRGEQIEREMRALECQYLDTRSECIALAAELARIVADMEGSQGMKELKVRFEGNTIRSTMEEAVAVKCYSECPPVPSI